MKILLVTFCLSFVISPFSEARPSWMNLKADDFQVVPQPKPGSVVDRADTETLLSLQASRTEAQCAEVEAQGSADFKSLYRNAHMLTDSEFKRLKPVMRRMTLMVVQIAREFKSRFGRPRPSVEDSRILPCGGPHLSTKDSYPSSHASSAMSVACVLTRVYPERAAELKVFAEHMGELRVLGGLHHPSDIVAGEKLGADICQRLLGNQKFLRDLQKAAN